MILLHGTLEATIFEAQSLFSSSAADNGAAVSFKKESPTLGVRRFAKRFSWIKRVSFCRPKVVIANAKGLPRVYATIDIEKARVGRTRVITKEPNSPRWYESFRIYCAHMAADVIFTVKADNPIGATVLGRAYLPVEHILRDEQVDRWLDICDEDRNPVGDAKIHVRLRYVDVARDADNWSRGIPNTFFAQRQSCRVTLYQDAHIADGFTPRIPMANGVLYEPRRCWEDVFDAISNARRFVYIAGWSVYAEIALVRDPNSARQQQTLGELLKTKASQGVRVLMLVWNDRTSVSLGVLKRDGLMATHDQDTAAYFRGSAVRCVLCPRNPDVSESYVQDLQVATMFTHHQKTIVVDGGETLPNTARDSGSSKTRIVSFLGGIDLCDGRYDTQQHSLFRTLGTVHRTDFHQPNFEGASVEKGGPREPWHDIHCRLEGPVAWDVLYNFEQRWIKQGDGKDMLVSLPTGISGPVVPGSTDAMAPLQPQDSWNVQLFRSIDGGAAYGFPDAPEKAAEAGLVTGKDHVMERSIQDAYINAIRRAKNFIYIENQYFLGSSFSWRKDDGIDVDEIGALHLIPKELSLKIVSKIEAREQFTVYIVIPMWPEGIPESASVQAILDWQRRTMEMMYTDIAIALQAKGIQGENLKDYLTFFCLANREVKKQGEYQPTERPEPGTDYERAQQARRFMIYVHAKMMIVDDEYIIIGSANINQRSMDGGRDTEIAIGAYQPYYLEKARPRGQVRAFRLALWYEHLGMLEDSFLQPQSKECVQRINRFAGNNWVQYAQNELNKDLQGHLLGYPIDVVGDGTVGYLKGMECFPDTKARILGNKSDYIPPILTT